MVRVANRLRFGIWGFKIQGVFRGCYPSLLGPVDPSIRVLSGRLKLTVRRHKFNKDSHSSGVGVLGFKEFSGDVTPVQRFRGGLVFKAHRLGVSLKPRLESNKKKVTPEVTTDSDQ